MDAKMKKQLALTGVAIAIAAFVIPLPETRSLQAAPPKGIALPDFERGGTWGALNRQAMQTSQSRIRRSFTREGVRFVVGKRKGRFETFQETMFSGGVTYIRLRPVKLIQQVPESQ
ncbi:hypothetical protein Pla52o_52550 [Novipirellula galeiformis]|uniref:Uncharacterized protein n=2 Tax=Novipirellula galeiformis TaxID=2528004 RepID=A0A5C6C1E7_9BACT|nr:hypothetical protein Pla52o_52550 [Novipirellula galeiformis]